MSRAPPTCQQGVSKCSEGTCPGQMDSTQSAGSVPKFFSFLPGPKRGLVPKGSAGWPLQNRPRVRPEVRALAQVSGEVPG